MSKKLLEKINKNTVLSYVLSPVACESFNILPQDVENPLS
jgi:hypothetical protein